MEPGAGAWVRVLDGKLVLDTAYDKTLTEYDCVPVPKEAFLCTKPALDKFRQFSCVKVEEQHAILVHDGKGISFENLTDAQFVAAADPRPFFFPPAASKQRSGLLPVTESHLREIFGVCPLTTDTLAAWNQSVAGALALRNGANRGKDSVLVMNAAQRTYLIQLGVVRMDKFDPPAFETPPPAMAEAAAPGASAVAASAAADDDEEDIVITEADIAAVQKEQGGYGMTAAVVVAGVFGLALSVACVYIHTVWWRAERH